MINKYEVEVTLKKKITFVTDQSEANISNIFDRSEDYADDFDYVEKEFSDGGFKNIESEEHCKCEIDGLELIEEDI